MSESKQVNRALEKAERSLKLTHVDAFEMLKRLDEVAINDLE